MTDLPSPATFRADLPDVLTRFRAGRTRAFSIGDGVPEAVVLTHDEFEDLDGESKLQANDEPLSVDDLAAHLPAVLQSLQAHPDTAVLWGEDGRAEAVLVSTTAYRTLRGDDQPPAGVVDDPTERTYATEPLPTSSAMSMDEIAELMGPEAVEELARLRREDRESP
ncbi:hypothetical protein [Kribbella sp. NPDC051770]|uniref:hypothetical protein n=1 Tax=Kribbella sp. NPDC051770 TaxID=3155413 RepID=UPI003415B4AC